MQRTSVLLILVILGLSVLPRIATGQSQPSFHKIHITITGPEDLQRVRALGFDFEGARRLDNKTIELIASEDRLPLLERNEIPYEIIRKSMEKFFAKRASEAPRIQEPDGFGYGSMAGFYTFDELVQKLDSLHLRFPGIVSEKQSIGTTYEGREIWAVKISDNPDANEPEPEVLYTALHHAREPGSMMSVLYYMYWLSNNYATSPDATYLVDNREMWFVPCVNPDGYAFNQWIYEDSDGSSVGMWRKNKRDNNANNLFEWSQDGVDLNRNYDAHWGYDDYGSSGDNGDPTYRGPAPFSEPETQAIQAFVNGHEFAVALNYHTYGDLMIYPYGYEETTYPPQPDYSIFKNIAQQMTDYNGYRWGTGPDILYVTNGDSDDWMYDTEEHETIFSLTPEVGGSNDSFWPSPARIFPLVRETLYQNKFLARVAGAFPVTTGLSGESGASLTPGDTGNVSLFLENQGLESTPVTFTVQVESPGGLLTIPDTTLQVGRLESLGTDTLSLPVQVNDMCTNGSRASFIIEYRGTGLIGRDTIDVFIGDPVFTDNAESGMIHWNTTSWGVTTDSTVNSQVFTDSPGGNYSNNSLNTMTLSTPLDFSDLTEVHLRFKLYCMVEADYDFAQVLISTDNFHWNALEGEYMREGSGYGVQDGEEFGYDGHRGWLTERIDLSEYAGEDEVSLRFNITSDNYLNSDGISVDDITIYGKTRANGPLISAEPDSLAFDIPFGWWNETYLTLANLGSDSLIFAIRENSVTDGNTTAATLPQKYGSSELLSIFSRQTVRSQIQNSLDYSPDEIVQNSETTSSATVIQDTIGDIGGDVGIVVPDIQSVTVETDTIFLGQRTTFDIQFRTPVSDTIVGLISLDADQNHATGAYPAALGILPKNVSIGAEYEIFLFPQGLNFSGGFPIDTTISIPTGSAWVIDMSDTSVVGFGGCDLDQPGVLHAVFLPGAGEFSMDGSRFNFAVSCLAGSIADTSLAGIPDFAPNIGHGTYGEEQGVAWLGVAPLDGSIPPEDETVIRLPAVASANQDFLSTSLSVFSNSIIEDSLTIPVELTVMSPPESHLAVNRSSVSDTLVPGYDVNSTLELINTGEGSLTYFVADTTRPAWYHVTPRGGVIAGGEAQVVQLTYSPDSTADGVRYSGNMFIASTSAGGDVISIPIEAVIGYSEVAQRGDVNRDAQILSDDVQLLSDLILSPGTPTPYQYWAGDVNLDGQLDITDVITLLNTLALE